MNYPKTCVFLLLIVFYCGQAFAQNAYFPKTLSMQQRAKVVDAWLEERIQTVLPGIMERTDIDMWLIIGSEYNEDPVIKTFLPATWQSARRTTMLLVYNPRDGKSLETYSISRYDTGKFFKSKWDKNCEDKDQPFFF